MKRPRYRCARCGYELSRLQYMRCSLCASCRGRNRYEDPLVWTKLCDEDGAVLGRRRRRASDIKHYYEGDYDNS